LNFDYNYTYAYSLLNKINHQYVYILYYYRYVYKLCDGLCKIIIYDPIDLNKVKKGVATYMICSFAKLASQYNNIM